MAARLGCHPKRTCLEESCKVPLNKSGTCFQINTHRIVPQTTHQNQHCSRSIIFLSFPPCSAGVLWQTFYSNCITMSPIILIRVLSKQFICCIFKWNCYSNKAEDLCPPTWKEDALNSARFLKMIRIGFREPLGDCSPPPRDLSCPSELLCHSHMKTVGTGMAQKINRSFSAIVPKC